MRVMKTDYSVHVWPNAALKNFILYIISMYEFLHKLGQTLWTNSALAQPFVRCGPIAS